MPISRYPRRGYPLAPAILKTILAVRIPKKFLNGATTKAVYLSELDKSSWETLTPEACQGLGREIVEVIRGAISAFPESVLEATLTPLPSGTTLENLELEH
jgi:hypothetical protein